jgi:hypothetical protein
MNFRDCEVSATSATPQAMLYRLRHSLINCFFSIARYSIMIHRRILSACRCPWDAKRSAPLLKAQPADANLRSLFGFASREMSLRSPDRNLKTPATDFKGASKGPAGPEPTEGRRGELIALVLAREWVPPLLSIAGPKSPCVPERPARAEAWARVP